MQFVSPRFLVLALALTAGPLFAGNLVALRTSTLPAPPQLGPEARLLVVGGQPLILGRGAAALFDRRTQVWTPLDWPSETPVRGTAGDGRQAFLLLGPEPSGLIAEVALLSVEAGAVRARRLPPLPAAFVTAQGATQGGTFYLAGMGEDGAPRVASIVPDAAQPAWNVRAGWAEPGGAVTSLVAQNSALLATVRRGPGEGDRLWRWTTEAGWLRLGDVPGAVVDGAARAMGQAHALYWVHAVPEAGAAPQLRSFHLITGAWAALGTPGAAGARSVAAWQDGLVWLSPAVDRAGVGFVEIAATKHLLHPLDWLVIAVYLAGMTGIGLYFYLREKKHSTADFFVGGRTIPFWAAGISLYATNTSSISYIAIPAKSFATNWQYLTNNLVAVLGLTFVALWIVPLLRRLDLMSVFHYLENRFHPAIRTISSALCIVMQLGGRMSVVLFLPSLAISTVSGLDVVWSILLMGTVTIAYTALGGMKAVIWTDCLQLFVMFGGALFAIGFIILKLDGGFGEFVSTATAGDKTRLFDWSFDLTKATVWGFVFLVLFDVVLTFPKDQVLMQRALSTKSAKEAGRSIWTFAAIMVPGGFLFYLIGTALFVFYQSHPGRMNPLLSIDATFPLFIAAELPVGVTGVIIAGILAASMSTLSSILNSVATLASVDFYEQWRPRSDPAASVRVAEWMTVGAGLIGMGLALLLSRYDINSLFDVSIELSGLLSGGFAGAYTLGMFTRRANWQGVVAGIAASILLTVVAWSRDLVHPYFYMPISILICIVVGYGASHLFPPPAQSLRGLTIYREPAEAGGRR